MYLYVFIQLRTVFTAGNVFIPFRSPRFLLLLVNVLLPSYVEGATEVINFSGGPLFVLRQAAEIL